MKYLASVVSYLVMMIIIVFSGIGFAEIIKDESSPFIVMFYGILLIVITKEAVYIKQLFGEAK